MNTIIDIGACGLSIYLAAQLFLVLRKECRRRNGSWSADGHSARVRCIIGAGAVSVAAAAFLIGAVVL